MSNPDIRLMKRDLPEEIDRNFEEIDLPVALVLEALHPQSQKACRLVSIYFMYPCKQCYIVEKSNQWKQDSGGDQKNVIQGQRPDMFE